MSFVIFKPEQFDGAVEDKLGEHKERARAVFLKYGTNRSELMVLMLRAAAQQEKLPEVLTVLEECYEDEVLPAAREYCAHHPGALETVIDLSALETGDEGHQKIQEPIGRVFEKILKEIIDIQALKRS